MREQRLMVSALSALGSMVASAAAAGAEIFAAARAEDRERELRPYKGRPYKGRGGKRYAAGKYKGSKSAKRASRRGGNPARY